VGGAGGDELEGEADAGIEDGHVSCICVVLTFF
jgi:hypothetical protein